jgi:hypothetical protein
MPQTNRISSRSAGQHRGAEKRKAELSPIRKRQYKHILESEKQEGRTTKAAKRIAMATVNKTRRKKGELKKQS